jgi:hypothetical protein
MGGFELKTGGGCIGVTVIFLRFVSVLAWLSQVHYNMDN